MDIAKQKKIEATDGYEKVLNNLIELKKMTDTSAWRKTYSQIIAMRKEHARMILIEEKTREMVARQEAIKFIDSLLEAVQKPISDLNEYCVSMPLFAKEFHTRGQWNAAIGTVELSESR